MKPIHTLRAAAGAVVALAGAFLGVVAFAPSAFALVAAPVADGTSSVAGPVTAPANGHAVLVTGGMAAWQIALIALGAALVAATLAVYTDRARGSNRKVRMSAA